MDISGIAGPVIKLIGSKYKRYKDILYKPIFIYFLSRIKYFKTSVANLFLHLKGLFNRLASIVKLLLLVIINLILLYV